jgi:hypothetical protein
MLINDENNEETPDLSFYYPESAFLTFTNYFHDEKELNSKNDFSLWEKFVGKYFPPTIEMNIKIMEGDKVYHNSGKSIT